MATYTGKQMYQGQPGTSAGNLYGPTAATKAIIRNIVFANTADYDSWVSISIGTTGVNTAATRLFDKLLVPSPSTASHGSITWSGMVVLESGNYITGIQQNASVITVTISGIEIS